LVQAQASPALASYGKHLAESLPPQGAMVMSDDPLRLYAVAAALDGVGTRKNYVLLDSSAIQLISYHKYLRRHYGDRWPTNKFEESGVEVIDSLSLAQLIYDLARTNFVCYLHPSFGYYLEVVYLKPSGLIYQLLPNSPKIVETAALSSAE